MNHAEQEFFYVAAIRPDGGQPHLGKAIDDRVFMDYDSANEFLYEESMKLRGQCRFAVYRAVARIPAKPEAGER